eukprot:gene25619-biopygen39546
MRQEAGRKGDGRRVLRGSRQAKYGWAASFGCIWDSQFMLSSAASWDVMRTGPPVCRRPYRCPLHDSRRANGIATPVARVCRHCATFRWGAPTGEEGTTDARLGDPLPLSRDPSAGRVMAPRGAVVFAVAAACGGGGAAGRAAAPLRSQLGVLGTCSGAPAARVAVDHHTQGIRRNGCSHHCASVLPRPHSLPTSYLRFLAPAMVAAAARAHCAHCAHAVALVLATVHVEAQPSPVRGVCDLSVDVAGFASPQLNGAYVKDPARVRNGRETYWRGDTKVIYWCSKGDKWEIGKGSDFSDRRKIGPDQCYGWALGAASVPRRRRDAGAGPRRRRDAERPLAPAAPAGVAPARAGSHLAPAAPG